MMSEIQAEHDEAMKKLQEEMEQAVQRNEAFQQLLAELDRNMAEQIKDFDRAKSDLEGKSDSQFEDPDLRGMICDLEEAKCELNQVEEEIMHQLSYCAEITGGAEVSSESGGDLEAELGGYLETLKNLRTSTPMTVDTESSISNVSFNSSASTQFPSFMKRQLGRFQGLSFNSVISQPTSTTLKRKRQSGLRNILAEVSSTQG